MAVTEGVIDIPGPFRATYDWHGIGQAWTKTHPLSDCGHVEIPAKVRKQPLGTRQKRICPSPVWACVCMAVRKPSSEAPSVVPARAA